MAASDNNRHALDYWPGAFDAIPKSVFATVAWHLANLASGAADAPGAAEPRFAHELAALARAGIIPAAQARRALAVLPEPAESFTGESDE